MFSFFKKDKDKCQASDINRFLFEVNELKQQVQKVETGIVTTPLRIEDAACIYSMSKIDDIRNELIFFKNHTNLDYTSKVVRGFISHINAEPSCFFQTIRNVIICDGSYRLDSSLFMGIIALLPVVDLSEIRNVGSRHQLIFATLPQFRNKGFMKTALEMVLDAMYINDYSICAAQVSEANKFSERLLLNAGFINNVQTGKFNRFVKRLNMSEAEFKRECLFV